MAVQLLVCCHLAPVIQVSNSVHAGSVDMTIRVAWTGCMHVMSLMMCWCRYVLLQQEDDDSARKAASNRREAAEVECEKVRRIGLVMHVSFGMAQCVCCGLTGF